MAGVPQKTAAQKRLEGTYRADRDGERARAEALVASVGTFYPQGTVLRPPKSLATRKGRSHWREVSRHNVALGMLSPVDLPQLERMCLLYEETERLRPLLQARSPLDEGYGKVLSDYLKAAKAYDELAAKYYVSPQARSRLALDALNVTKAAQDVRAADDGIGQLLARR